MEEGEELNLINTNVTTDRAAVEGGVDTINEFAQNDVILKPNGTTITREKILNEAISFYNSAYMNGFSDICDFSEGSEIRTLHESFIVELFSLYKEMFRSAKMKFVLDAEDTYLDRLACEVHLTRNGPTPARGSVTFESSETLNGNISIPMGTVILSQDDGEEYILEQNVVITSSATPVNGTVHSKNAGSKYNKDEHKLTAFQNISAIKYGVSVTNNSKIVGGSDGESDDSFRNRILQAKRNKAWGTISQYNDLIKNGTPNSTGSNGVSYVHDIQFVEPEKLASNKGYPRHYKSGVTSTDIAKKNFDELQNYLCTECTRVVFVNGTMKPCLDTVVEEVEYFLTQQNNLVVGQLFHVERCEVRWLYFKMDLWCTQTVSEETIYNHLTTYFDGGHIETKRGAMEYPGLDIHEKVTKNDLLNVIESIPGVEQCATLYRLKYDADLSTTTNITWIDNKDNSYTYLDGDGYIFRKTGSENGTVNPWGWINFSTIQPMDGRVLGVGRMKDVEENNEHIFDLNINLIEEK